MFILEDLFKLTRDWIRGGDPIDKWVNLLHPRTMLADHVTMTKEWTLKVD